MRTSEPVEGKSTMNVEAKLRAAVQQAVELQQRGVDLDRAAEGLAGNVQELLNQVEVWRDN